MRYLIILTGVVCLALPTCAPTPEPEPEAAPEPAFGTASYAPGSVHDQRAGPGGSDVEADQQLTPHLPLPALRSHHSPSSESLPWGARIVSRSSRSEPQRNPDDISDAQIRGANESGL